MTRFVAITSGKGGVGRTTVAINLASALNTIGKSTILFDGNTHNPNIGLNLGFSSRINCLNDVLSGRSNINDVVYWHPSGMKVVPYFHKPSIQQKSSIGKELLNLFGKAEVIISDTTLDHLNDDIIHTADEAIIVTNKEKASIKGAKKAIASIESLGTTVIGSIINDIGHAGEKIKDGQIENYLGKKVLGTIPRDKRIISSFAEFKPSTINYPWSRSSKEFRNIAEMLK